MRPTFHFTAARGWINDPHGITYHDGRYHVFYQYVPDSPEWAPNCHWGHATSPDLFSFERQPVAIAPGEGDGGIWTGCLVTDDSGDATIFYTAVTVPDVGVGRVRVARPMDASWTDWVKGPVVAEAPVALDALAYRDPFVLRDGDGWRMTVGAALQGGTATALSYVSPDLVTWTYDGVIAKRSTHEREPVWTGTLWECPQFFELDGRDVMVTSVWDADVLHYAAYALGELRDGRFRAEVWGRLTYGDVYYAPSFFRDATGRPCLTFWMRQISDAAAGWAGAHSVPHVLSLDGDRLVAAPHPGLSGLHGTARPDGVDGLAADLTWEGRHLTIASGGTEVVQLSTDTGGVVKVAVGADTWSMPHTGGPVRVILDGPVLEVSAPGGLLAAVIHPDGDSLDVHAAGAITLHSVSVA